MENGGWIWEYTRGIVINVCFNFWERGVDMGRWVGDV